MHESRASSRSASASSDMSGLMTVKESIPAALARTLSISAPSWTVTRSEERPALRALVEPWLAPGSISTVVTSLKPSKRR